MKIFFALTIVIVIAVGLNIKSGSSNDIVSTQVYKSPLYNYEISYPENFVLDPARPELVTLRAGEDWLRVNVGCFDFGTEGLVAANEFVSLNDQSVLKQTFYENSRLKFIRYVLTPAERCIYLEIFPHSEYGRQVLEDLVSSFRIH